MSKADEFRQYAEEAMRWAHRSKNEKERLALLELARTWMQAALHRENTAAATNHRPPEGTVLDRRSESQGRLTNT
jgi:hypothetical protein